MNGKENSYQAIVVGAGPVGSMAALKLARQGVKVLVIDKKREIGAPVRCGENIGVASLERLGLPTDAPWIERHLVRQHYIALDNHITTRIQTVQLNRKLFEQYLAKEAIRAGANYRLNTELVSLIKEGGAIKGITALSQGEKTEFFGKLIIAADGVDSLTAKMAGFPTENPMPDYASGFQYHMTNLRLEDPDAIYFYVDKDALGGYIWVFPRSENTANVGIGMVQKKGLPHVKTLLDNFIRSHPEIFKEAEMVEMVSGGVALRYTFPCLVGHNIMLAGDAAHMVSAISGGGMSWGMLAAQEAANVAALCIARGDCSREALMPYERTWHRSRQLGRKLRFFYTIRRYAETFDEETINRASAIVTKQELDDIARRGSSFYIPLLFRKFRQVFPFLKGYLKMRKKVLQEMKESDRKILKKRP